MKLRIFWLALVSSMLIGAAAAELDAAAIAKLEAKAEAGDSDAWLALGEHLLAADRSAEDRAKGAGWLRLIVAVGRDEDTPAALEILQEQHERILAEYPHLVPVRVEGQRGSVGVALDRTGEHEAAVKLLIREAKLLLPSAQIYLQHRYYMDAEGLVLHDPRILAHFEATAAEGLPRSKIMLANILIRGAGVESDVPRAVALLEEAGAQGFFDAYWDLRALASAGGDEEWAERWCEKGAALGDHRGWYCVGMFASARGEDEKAFLSLEKARELRPDAAEVRIQLALWLVAGKGTPRNPEQGFAMMKKAADEAEGRERAEAQAHLGIMYSVGVGVEESEELGHAYMEQAAAAGHEGAADWLKRAAGKAEAQSADP